MPPTSPHAENAQHGTAYGDLRGKSFEGADLQRARLRFVDLSGANLGGARLRGAAFRHVSAVGTRFDAAAADDVFMEHVDLTGASFVGTDLRRAIFRESTLRHSRFDNADLADSKLVHCRADGIVLRGARLTDAVTVHSTVEGADLVGARDFATCRELVVEILREAIRPGDVEQIKLLGALAIQRTWCYPEWAKLLAGLPTERRLVLDAFRQYPESGLAEALLSA